MMRGGGETRHLAWARELAALGVQVDIIAGIPLVSGAARYPVEGVDVGLIRSPYARDFVYRCQNRRGFGRLTMTALHLSVPSSNSWEEDILGEQVDGGESVEVTIDDNLEDCEYDIRADFDDGTHIDVRGVNFCELEGETITISE